MSQALALGPRCPTCGAEHTEEDRARFVAICGRLGRDTSELTTVEGAFLCRRCVVASAVDMAIDGNRHAAELVSRFRRRELNLRVVGRT